MTTVCFALETQLRIQIRANISSTGWRGRNERTGMEGIFPRSYVNVIDEKPPISSPAPTNYGNMPLEVSQGGPSSTPSDPNQKSKFEEGGKKFGKKLGNAGMFPLLTLISFKKSDPCSSNLRCRCYCWFQHCEQHFLGSRCQPSIFEVWRINFCYRHSSISHIPSLSIG